MPLLLVTASGRRKSGLGKRPPDPHVRAWGREARPSANRLGLGRLRGFLTAARALRSSVLLGRPWVGKGGFLREPASLPETPPC